MYGRKPKEDVDKENKENGRVIVTWFGEHNLWETNVIGCSKTKD